WSVTGVQTCALPISQRVGALHGQQVELLALQHKPDRDRDCLTGLSADHAELDLAVVGEAFFEVILLRDWHSTLLWTHLLRPSTLLQPLGLKFTVSNRVESSEDFWQAKCSRVDHEGG